MPGHVRMDFVAHYQPPVESVMSAHCIQFPVNVTNGQLQLSSNLAYGVAILDKFVGWPAICVDDTVRSRQHNFASCRPALVHNFAKVRPVCVETYSSHVVETEHHGHEVWLVAEHVSVDAGQSVCGRVAADPGVDHFNFRSGS